jgi:large subunit ribosomal protein L4
MNITVLDLDNLQETTEVLEGFDFENIEGESCVPFVLKWQLANRRLGTASVKLASEVSGSTKKIVRQKGTGGARHGGKRAVQFRGGRTCFGPRPRDFGFSIPKKIVKKALSYVLLNKIKDNKVILIDGMDKLEISTNKLNKKLKGKNINSALVAYNEEYDNFLKSLRNMYEYKSLFSSALNVYDVLHYDFLLLDRKAFDKFKEVL